MTEYYETWLNKNRDKKRLSDKRYHEKIKERGDYKIKKRVQHYTNAHEKKNGRCTRCMKITKTIFHHFSYDPVIFAELCLPCHRILHSKYNLTRLEKIPEDLLSRNLTPQPNAQIRQ